MTDLNVAVVMALSESAQCALFAEHLLILIIFVKIHNHIYKLSEQLYENKS